MNDLKSNIGLTSPGNSYVDPVAVRDHCREYLAKHLVKALKHLPSLKNLVMLDMGCGSGVPTIVLANHFNGKVFAVDSDIRGLTQLRRKITRMKLTSKITICRKSVFDMEFGPDRFDLVIAEGLLNVIGFENGLKLADQVLKNHGYLILHDEAGESGAKQEILTRYHYQIIQRFTLDEQVWWDDFYSHLNSSIEACDAPHKQELFKNDLAEIMLYHEKPELFRSVYYVLRKATPL
jgi:ubiquinone/menaquinone biosynthesis C-methylase UbiE